MCYNQVDTRFVWRLIMKKQFIKDFKVGDKVNSLFGVSQKILANFAPTSPKAPGQFLKLRLMDASGTIEARVWDNAASVAQLFDEGDVVLVEGVITEFNGLQINISKLKKWEKTIDPSHFQPSTKKDRKMMAKTLNNIVSSIENPYLKKLLLHIFSSKQTLWAYLNAPAAQRIHHAYVGGLLEHSLEVVHICENIASAYSEFIDRDLLVTGALLHDIGKIAEYNVDSITFEMTDTGKLLGHIVLGKEFIDNKIQEIGEFPEELRLALDHMMIAHHGEKDWGSPEVPKTIEAFSLFHADLVSARINQFASLISEHKDKDSLWTSWDKFLSRSIYVKEFTDKDNDQNEIA